MLKTLALGLTTALALCLPASAHEVWLERDGAGPARIYLGEPADAVPDNGDPEFPKLQNPVVFTSDVAKPATLIRKANHIEATVAEPGDVRLRDDAVFEPWDDENVKAGVIYYARSGRTDTKGVLDLELVPVAADSDEFVATFRGAPLADASVVIITPDKWQKTFKTDTAGKITVPSLGTGRYLVSVTHELAEKGQVHGDPVEKVMHVSTLTFVR